MNEFEAYQLYLAVKRHFSSSYDAFKYNFKVKASASAFETRRDKWHFYKLSKKDDPRGLLVANAIEDNVNWIGDVIGPVGEENYKKWLQRQQSITYRFQSDINNMLDDFNENFIPKSGQHPPLLKKYRQGDLTLETMVIINDIVNYIPTWEDEIEDTILWPQVKRLFLKYKPFLKYDVFEMKKILKRRFE